MGVLKGWSGYVRVSDTKNNLSQAPDPRLQSNPFTFTNNDENVYIIGSRVIQEVIEGNQELSGTFERHFNGSYCGYYSASEVRLDEMCGLYLTTNTSSFIMHVAPNGSGNAPEFFIRDVKFSDYSFDMTQDGITTETASWMGINISTA